MSDIKNYLKKTIWGTIPYFFCSVFSPKSDKIVYYKYMKRHGYTRHPFPFAEKYTDMSVEMKIDETKGLRYVMHRGTQKLYFSNKCTDEKIIGLYKSLTIEQDIDSAHHYVESLKEFEGKTLLDIGSAEGFSSLDAIEYVDFVYLFECDPSWIEALEATFEPWKEKVQIVKRYISDKNNESMQTLDSFLEDKSKDNLFLKMDIEGEERNALKGAEKLFSEAKNLDFAICTYHRKDDEKVITSFLDKHKCIYAQRKGHMYVTHTFRPCLVRGYKA